MSNEAKKFDGGKLKYELIPIEALREIVKVYTFGANKYGDRNWEQGMDWGRMYGAAQRHLNEYAGRNDVDSESGLYHLAHAATCIMMLLQYQIKDIGNDNRAK